MSFQSEYRGSTTGFGFGSFRRKAADATSKAKKRTEEMVRDAKTKTWSDSLSFQGQLRASKLAAAQAKTSSDMLKGLAGIVGQTATGINRVKALEDAEQRRIEAEKLKAEEEAWDEGYYNFIMDETATELPPELQAEDDALVDQEIEINAGARASAEISNDVMTEAPNDEGVIVSSELNNETTYQQIAPLRISAQELHATLPANIQAEVVEMPASQIPSDPRERAALIRGMIQQKVRQAGPLTKFQKAKLAGALKQAYGNAAQALASRRASFLKEEGAARTEQELDALALSGLDGQSLWDQARDAVAFSTGNGSKGYSALNTKKAYDALTKRLVGAGDVDSLRKLLNAVINPNTGQKIGDVYKNDLNKAIMDAEKVRMSNFDSNMASQKHELTSITQQYLHGELSREDAIAALSAMDTPAAYAEIKRLQNGNSINFRPELEYEIESRANTDNPVPQGVIDEWRSQGYISDKIAKKYGPSGESAQISKQVKEMVGADERKLMEQLLMSNTTSKEDIRGEIAKQHAGAIKSRVGLMQDLIRRDLQKAILKNPGMKDNPAEMREFIEQRINSYLKEPRFIFDDGPKGTRGYKAPLVPPKQASDLDNARQTEDGTWTMATVGTGQLSSASPAQLNPSRNFVILKPQLIDEMQNLAEGKPVGERVSVIARRLGISEYEVVNQQAKKYGLPSIGAITEQKVSSGESAPAAPTANGDMKAGYSMIRGLGVPHKGAAYLAGNIMQESSWNGQRSPWGEVAGDRTDRNGGLVSWMDDAGRGHFRLKKIEQKLGKPINQATDREQLQAMLSEMKSGYPDAYRVFMNPNSSDADLRWASMRYWGYGHEGSRFNYARQLDNNPVQVQRTSNTTAHWGSPIYRIESRGYGSTGPHLDVKPVERGGVYGKRSMRMKPQELDPYVGVQTASGVKPLSQGTTITSTDADHRARANSSYGVDYAAPMGTQVVLRNGARVIENWQDPDPNAQGSVRTVIELPDGRRYAFVHGTVPNA